MASELVASTGEIDLSNPEYYFNRELSWLEFNDRVLHEATDPRTPLLERLKFLAIFSANLDEYFMVRVAALKQKVEAQVETLSPDGRSPQAQLDLISQRLRPMVTQQHRYFEQILRPELAAAGVYLLDYIDLNPAQRRYLQEYFEAQIFPVLTPLAIDSSHPFPHISNLSLNLAVLMQDQQTGAELFARVKVPGILPRFLSLPTELQSSENPVVWTGIPLEQAIAHNLNALFPGMKVDDYHLFRVTRDGDLDLEEDDAGDLMQAVEQELRKRRLGGSVVRLEVEASMPDAVRAMLLKIPGSVRDNDNRETDLSAADTYEIAGLLGLRDLFSLSLPLPELKDPPWRSTVPAHWQSVIELDRKRRSTPEEDLFSLIRKQDLLLHHPYHSFSRTVQRFIETAATDPEVLAIKMTLYRTSGDSPIVDALITAAEHGKQVSVLVELKARFDEANNINWARKLEGTGVHVIYGLPGLKTHTKIVLVVRREAGQIQRYVHIGTGNYNPKTSRIYTDMGLLSSRADLGADLTELFNHLTGYSRQQSYRKLLVAPVNLRDRFLALIQREAEHVSTGSGASACGRIVAKMNALTDPAIAAALYAASQAGVQVDLIVRGMCCLRPGVPGISDRIRVISIVGRFLEHSRIFYFHNAGQEEIFLGSADWMPRNLDRRVEAVVPVEDPAIVKDLQEILGIMLADNRQAWDLQPDGSYIQRRPPSEGAEINAQKILMKMAQQAAES
jgi:polyphosphate kinase